MGYTEWFAVQVGKVLNPFIRGGYLRHMGLLLRPDDEDPAGVRRHVALRPRPHPPRAQPRLGQPQERHLGRVRVRLWNTGMPDFTFNHF